jgi:GcrA cell cycle regulator
MVEGQLELVERFRIVIPYLVTHEMWWVTARENRMEWTANAIDLLRALWAEGHSTAEIGRRMGVTKNAIVGKAHRLDLPTRPSPIRKPDAAAVAAAAGAAAPRRKPSAREAVVPARRMIPQAQPMAAPPAAPRLPPLSAAVRSFPRASVRSCCWPMGEPGSREFRFCGAEADPGKPYCAAHVAVAYVRVRDRRSDAA